MPSKEENLYRSSFAIRKEKEAGLKMALSLLKVSLGELLTMLAEDPVRAEQVLGEWAKEHRDAKAASAPRGTSELRARRKELSEAIKKADPQTLAKLLEQLQAQQQHGSEQPADAHFVDGPY